MTTELDKALGRTRWTRLHNRWKNLSRFWSPKERRLQAVITELHTGIGELLVDTGLPVARQPDEDFRDVREVPKMFPDQKGGYLG